MTRRVATMSVAGILAALAAMTVGATASSERAVLKCQTSIARSAERVVRARQRALAVCLGRESARCSVALARSDTVTARLPRAARPCLGLPDDLTLGLDGIGWEVLGPVCPDTTVRSLGTVLACLETALPCVAEVALADAIPEAVAPLAERGIAIDRGCLVPPVCGNGEREGTEECDDGNLDPGDGCDETCRREVGETCGDGVVDDDEECDDGPDNSDTLPDHCRTMCIDPYCGDGVVDPDEGEDCEPPNTAACDEDCFLRDDEDEVAASSARAVGVCETPLVRAVARVTRKVQRQVAACALAIARCSLVDDDPADRCLARAEARCAVAAARRLATPDRLAARLQRSCPEDGPPFAERLANAACAAEAAVSRAIPRAADLVLTELFDLDGDEAFPCLTDLSDLE